MNEDLIQWLRKEADRYVRLKNDKSHTCRRRRTFKYRVHQLRKAADKLEELSQ